VNEQASRLFQYSNAELMQLKIFDLEATPGSEKNWSRFWNEMKEKGHMILESSVRKKDGTVFPMEVNTTFFRDQNQEIKITHGRDITERKRAEEERSRILVLEEKNKELEQYAFIASHDLQEPLRTVNTFATLLRNEYGSTLDENGTKYITFI